MFNKQIKCPNCEYEGKGNRVGVPLFKGVVFMIISFLFCWTVIIPILYFSWAVKNFNNHECPKCGYKNVVIE